MRHISTSITNWRTKTWFAFSLALLSLLFSCKKSNNLGVNTGDVEILYVDTFSVQLKTYLKDSIITSSNNSMLLGYFNSTLFGSTKEIAYTSLSLSKENLDLGSAPVLINAVMYLFPQEEFAIDPSNKLIDLEVYELDAAIGTGVYYNSDTIAYSTKVASESSTGYEIGQSKILNLDYTYGSKLLSFVNNTTQDQFDLNVDGIALAPLETSNVIYQLDLGSLADTSKNYIRLTYSSFNESTSITDTLYYDVWFDQDSKHFTGSSESLSGTDISAISNSMEVSDVAIMKGTLNERFSFGFPGLPNHFKNISSRMIINSAELVFEVESEEQIPLNTISVRSLDSATDTEESIFASVVYSNSTYTVSGPLFAEEILYQIENGLNQEFLFGTSQNDVVSQIKVKDGSVQLKIYYSIIN